MASNDLKKILDDLPQLSEPLREYMSSPALEALKTMNIGLSKATADAANLLLISGRWFEMDKTLRISEKLWPSLTISKQISLADGPYASILKTQKLISESISRITDPSSSVLSLSKKLAALDGGFAKYLETNASIATRYKDLLKDNISGSATLKLAGAVPAFDSHLADAFRKMSGRGDFKSGTAVIAGAADITEANDVVSAFGTMQQVPALDAESEGLAIWWARQPIQVRAFFLVMLFFLHSTVDSYIHERTKDWMHASTPTERQNIHDEVTQSLGADALKQLRFVRAGKLRVRTEASLSATVIVWLPRGTGVEIIETKGSWSLICFKDISTNGIKQGWAASSYLVANLEE